MQVLDRTYSVTRVVSSEATDSSSWTPSPRPDGAIISYSQNAEDIRLARVFNASCGFYVDVGAGDPTEFSVTKLFYDRGWSGINIEPGPAFVTLEQERPHDVNLNLAVAPTSDLRDFWVSEPHSGLSTFSPPDSSAPLPEGFRFERQTVETRPMSDILGEYAGNRGIDFMTIDVEGAEDDVIRSMDFERWRPKVLVVEAVKPLTHEPTHEEWEPLLNVAGYEMAVFDGINRFYVDRDHRHVIPALAYPITELDGYVTAATATTATEIERLTRALEDAIGARDERIRLAREYESALDSIMQSWSWRIGRIATAPARALSRLRG